MKKIILVLFLIAITIPIRINAKMYGAISGRVTTDTGEPVEGVIVSVSNFDLFMNINFINIKQINKESQTNKNGFYRVEELTSDTYYINLNMQVIPEKYKYYKESKKQTMPVELAPGRNLIDLNIVISRLVGTISGKVFKSDGVTNYGTNEAMIFLSKAGNRQRFEKNNMTTLNFNGEYEIKYLKTDEKYKIIIRDESTKKVYISDIDLNLSKATDIKNVNLVFKEDTDPTGFFGVVKNLNSSDAGLFIQCIKGYNFYFFSKINSDGTFDIKNLTPGEYYIEILTNNSNILKKMPLDSTFVITNYGESKRIDLIYDENRGVVMK